MCSQGKNSSKQTRATTRHQSAMQSETKERFIDLCRRATEEQDPEKLKLIKREMDRLLLDKADDLQRRKSD